MKNIAILFMLFILLFLCSCNTVSPVKTDVSSSEQESSEVKLDDLRTCKVGTIWDWYSPEFTATIEGIPQVQFSRTEKNGEVFANGEHLIGGTAYACTSFYSGDFTGDGVPELCFTMVYGSGICHQEIDIIDYTTGKPIYCLADRMRHDYYLFSRQGLLCVKETEYMKKEATRTGVFYYDENTAIQIAWDEITNDRSDTMANNISTP